MEEKVFVEVWHNVVRLCAGVKGGEEFLRGGLQVFILRVGSGSSVR